MSRIDASRRQFLRTAATTSMMGAGAPFAMNLALMSAAHAQTPGYRALVCIFLAGGNDSANMVLATDPTSWDAYVKARSTPPQPIALPAVGQTGGVLDIVPNTPQAGRTFALHPSMGALKTLFDAGRAAVVSNVGPLVEPITKAQWNARAGRTPPQLFSHNDQTSIWQAYKPEGARIGWGGRMGDLLAAGNGFGSFTTVSASGNAVFLSGETTVQFQTNGSGNGVQIGNLTGSLFGSTAATNPLRAITTNDRSNLFEKEHARIVKRAIDTSTALQTAMPAANALPAINAANQATVFTASEFGRTLTSNGDGTDHGWGAHHIVAGAAVRGKDVYGAFPAIGVNTNDDVGQGRLLPRIAVDQYAGTLAKWFGLSDAQIDAIFPNIVNFGAGRNLGFMTA